MRYVIIILKIIIRKITPYLPKKVAHSILFFLNHGYKINWSKIETYDEKLTWAMVHLIGAKEAIYADKYRVRRYIEQCGYGEMLPRIYDTWNNPKEINLENLPTQFVLKTNNGSGVGCIEICGDKETVDINRIKRKFKRALKHPIWKLQCEYQYKYIKPLIFAEELLHDNKEERMIDYKIHCFNGKAECILVCSNRAEKLKLDYYDTQWNYLSITPKELQSNLRHPCPPSLQQMIEAAEKISQIFPMARIDFYDVGGKPYFGEITLTPAGGNLYYINSEWQHKLGKLINFEDNKDSFSRHDEIKKLSCK